jgi:PAS domain S-box-containing protein
MLQSEALQTVAARIDGVADINPDAVGIKYARECGIFTTTDFRRLFDIPSLEIIVNLTGSFEVTRQLTDQAPESISVFPHRASRLFQEIVETVLGVSRRMDFQADEISRAHAFAQAMAQATIVGVIVLDLDFRIVWVNEAALRTAGLSRHEALGRYCFQISHQRASPCEGPGAPCPMKETLATGKAAHAMHEHRNSDGHSTYCDVSTFPLFNRAGEVVELVEIIRDITADLNEKFEQRTRKLKENLARMVQEDKLMALGKMVASVAHEINNPIGSIINFTMLVREFLEQDQIDQQHREKLIKYLSLSIREAERCGKIVGNLLSFARQQPMETKIIDLCEVVERVMHLTGHTMELAGIELKLEINGSGLCLYADENQIQQCLLNLVFNAIEAMPKGGLLTIGAGREKRNNQVCFSVTDQGTGISPEDLPHIYEPFFTTKSQGCGVGLGLSMVYGIIREHRGEISVESNQDRGTKFSVCLPAAVCPQ